MAHPLLGSCLLLKNIVLFIVILFKCLLINHTPSPATMPIVFALIKSAIHVCESSAGSEKMQKSATIPRIYINIVRSIILVFISLSSFLPTLGDISDIQKPCQDHK